ncbi:thiamine diphosphokinase [Ostreiculturibacter nitratireducens]|uniref:thiamine diphosphokinase n=1 Tax=Ostreiculturibacter nitratireducens TaxID=3075226 RepID=UPI0031B5989E
MRAIVHSSQGVTLIGGGRVARSAAAQAVAIAPRLVAADGGANRAIALGLIPEAVIGDLDSIGGEARERLGEARLFRVNEQETTDFEKSLLRIDAPFVLALGFAGPRLDHTLAAWNTIARLSVPPCLIVGEKDVVFAAPPRRRLALALKAGARVSLFPMARVAGRSTGLRWPIAGLSFAPDGRVGTSNIADGPVEVEFDAAGMLVILPRNCLRAAIGALLEA